jgi:hypothetical protein
LGLRDDATDESGDDEQDEAEEAGTTHSILS